MLRPTVEVLDVGVRVAELVVDEEGRFVAVDCRFVAVDSGASVKSVRTAHPPLAEILTQVSPGKVWIPLSVSLKSQVSKDPH